MRLAEIICLFTLIAGVAAWLMDNADTASQKSLRRDSNKDIVREFQDLTNLRKKRLRAWFPPGDADSFCKYYDTVRTKVHLRRLDEN